MDILLKGIDGGEVRVRRQEKSFFLQPYLTLVLTVQPIIINNLSRKKAYTGNGMLERFLYVLPKSKLGYRTHDKPAVPLALQAAYDATITSLLNNFFQQTTSPQCLKLTPPAYQLWRTFQAYIERQLRPDGQLAICQGWGGKICGYALRIAGLLQVAKGECNQWKIEASTMAMALDIAEILIQHAIVAYGLMGSDWVLDDAKEIFQWIKSYGQLSFTQSEITFAMRNKKVGKAERLSKALHVLIERHLISPPQRLPTRKPTMLYQVHPNVFSNERG